MKWQKVLTNKQKQKEKDKKRDLNPDFFYYRQVEEVNTQDSLISGTLIPKQSHNPLSYKSPTCIKKYWHKDEELENNFTKGKVDEE